MAQLDWRWIQPGSGPLKSHLEVVINTIAVAVGGLELSLSRPELGAFSLIVAVLVVIIGAIEIAFLWNERRSTAVLFLLTIAIAPLLSILVLEPRVLFVRYFSVSILFGLLLLASFLGRIWARGRGGRIVAILFVAGYLLGNADYLTSFWAYGRGDYLTTLRAISQSSSVQPPTIGSQQLFRDGMMVEYLREREPDLNSLVVVGSSELPSCPEWFLIQTQDRFVLPPLSLASMSSDRREHLGSDLYFRPDAAPEICWICLLYTSPSPRD